MKFQKLTNTEIDDILEQKNLVVRNLQITLGYHRITKGLQKLMGDVDVNWFGFGTYASKTAGQGIRHELLPKPLKSALIRSAGYDNTFMYLDEVLNRSNSDRAENMLAEVLTRVSLLLVAVLHTSEIWAAYWMLQTGITPNNLNNYWGYGTLLFLTAVIIVVTTGPEHLSRRNYRVTYTPQPSQAASNTPQPFPENSHFPDRS